MAASRCVIISTVEDRKLEELPGAEIVLAGVADLQNGRMSINALAVRSAASRLRSLGFETGSPHDAVPASHRLYEQLRRDLGDSAHSRYNAILSRVASFAQAAERARVR